MAGADDPPQLALADTVTVDRPAAGAGDGDADLGDASEAAIADGALVDDTFRLDRRLGGATSGLYLARDVRRGRDAALRFHRPRDAAATAAALREAKVLARLAHPNLVAVYAVGTYGGRVYLATEHVVGDTLRRWLDQRPRGWREVVAVMERAGRGLAAAHAAGLGHRDLDADDVLVHADGRVVVTGFDLAPPSPADPPADQRGFCLLLRAALGRTRPPGRVRRAIARGAADDPAARWPSMTALLAALHGALRRRRRVATVVAAGAAVLVAALVPRGLGRGGAARCSGGGARIAEVWSDARADRVRAALVAGGADAEVAAQVTTALDGFASAWTRHQRDACLATRVRGEHTARQLEAQTVCFEAARAQLQAAADLLEREPAASQRGPDVVAALPSVTMCADVRALSALVLPPSGEAAAATLELVRRDVAAAEARYVAGLRVEGYAAAIALPARARALGYRPLTAEALVVSAQYRSERDQRDAARAELIEAVRLALAAGADRTALLAARDLAWNLAHGARGDEALAWLATARGLADRIGESPTGQARLDTDEAIILRDLGRAAEAEPLARRGVTGAALADGERSLTAAAAHTNLGVVLFDLGRLAEAEAELRRSVAIHEAAVGRDHPETWEARLTLAFTLERGGKLDEGLAVVRDVAARMGQRLGPEDHRLARVVQVESGLLLDQGDVAGALRASERALALSARSPTPDPVWRGGLLGNIAVAEAGAGDLTAAIDAARRSLAEFRVAYPDDHAGLITPHQILGTLLRHDGQLEASDAILRPALALADRTVPFDHPDRVNGVVELAMTELARGQAAAAADRIATVMPVLARPGWAALNLAEARFALARATVAAGRARGPAIELARAARVGYVSLGPGYAEPVAAIDAWLAANPR